MIPFLVSYRTVAAVVVAESIGTARKHFKQKHLADLVGVDSRKVKVAQIKGVTVEGPELTEPKTLKVVG